MLLSVGSKVKLKHTGDRGEVREILPDGMLSVYIYDDDTEIPVFAEDLISDKAALFEGRAHQNKIEKPKSESLSKALKELIVEQQGIQLVFEPVYDYEGLTTEFKMWLLNDTDDDFIVSIKQEFKDSQAHEKSLNIPPFSKTLCGMLPYDRLNDNPVIDLQKWRITSKGTEGFAKNSLKIKPKTFFNKMKTLVFFDLPVYWFPAFPDSHKNKPKQNEDLRTYAKRNASPILPHTKKEYNYYKQHDVKEFASFHPEIDLHIESLRADTEGLNASQILRIQLSHFEDFMAKAIRVGVPRVFIIHGLGKGKLRDMIASKLMRMHEVETFKNEYHPKYGWGATEVIF